MGPTQLRCSTKAAGSSWRPSADDFALRGTTALRLTTDVGRCAGPAHSSTSSPSPVTLTSIRPSHSSTPTATTASTA